jgi:uncharacterized protein (TIGR00369 family)
MEPTDASGQINDVHRGTWAALAGVEVSIATRDEVRAKVAIRPDHRQPHGIVHGGVYATIIETLASVGAAIDAAGKGMHVVGLENGTSFVRAVREGTLHAIATPLTRGRRTQLWEVVVRNDEGAIAATGRVRLLVLEPDAAVAGAAIGGR